MNKEKFISELRKKLKRLPKEEVDNIIDYYSEYFNDADKDEYEVVKELGSPSAIASQILADYAFDDTKEKSNKRYLNRIIMIILAICAAPIAFPLGIVAIALIFVLLILGGVLLLTFGVVIFAFMIAGVATFIGGFKILFQSTGAGIFYIGISLLIAGISILLGVGIKNIAPRIGQHFKYIVRKLLLKLNKQKLIKGERGKDE